MFPARGSFCMARPSRGVSVPLVMVHKSCINIFGGALWSGSETVLSVVGPEANLLGMDFNDIDKRLGYLFGNEAGRC